MKKILLTILVLASLMPSFAYAGVTVNRLNNDHIEPLNPSDYFKASYIKATSTTDASTFAGPVGVGLTSLDAMVDVQGVADGTDNSTVLRLRVPYVDTGSALRIGGVYSDGLSFEGVLGTNNPSIINVFSANDNSQWLPANANIGAWSFGAAPKIVGNNNADYLYGFTSSPYSSDIGLPYNGTVGKVHAFDAQAVFQSGTASEYSLFDGLISDIGGASINNLYGLHLGDISGGDTSNYAIKTGLGDVSLGDTVILPTLTGSYGDGLRLNGSQEVSTSTSPIGIKLDMIYNKFTRTDTSLLAIGDSNMLPTLYPRFPLSVMKWWDVPFVGMTASMLSPGTGQMQWQNFSYNTASTTDPGAVFLDGGTNNTLFTFANFNATGATTTFAFGTTLPNLNQYYRGDWTKDNTLRTSWVLHKPTVPPASTPATNAVARFIKYKDSAFASPYLTQLYDGTVDLTVATTYATTTRDFTASDKTPGEAFYAQLENDYATPGAAEIGAEEFYIPNKSGFSLTTFAQGGTNDVQWAHNGLYTASQIQQSLTMLNRKPDSLMTLLGTNCGTSECVDTDAAEAAYKAHMETVVDNWTSDIVAVQQAAGNTGFTTASTTILLLNGWNYGVVNGGAELDAWARRRGHALRDIASERTNVAFLDMYQLLYNAYGQSFHTLLMVDGVHPNALGADVIGQMTWAAISGQNSFNPPSFLNKNGFFYSSSTPVSIGASTTPYGNLLTIQQDSLGQYFPFDLNITSSSSVPIFTVLENGKVGIGLTAPTSKLTVKGDIGTNGTIPTITSCGTSPAITLGSTDTAGEITEGSVSTGCTISFAATKARAPFCTVTEQAGLAASYSISSSAIIITNIGALSSTKINYHCINNDL